MPQSKTPNAFPLAILTIIALFLSACDRSSPPPAPAAAPPRPADVPAEGENTPTTTADLARAPAFAADPAIQKAIKDYIAAAHLAGPTNPWNLYAARPVGDYVLLWISFPKIADGGIDVIYSTKDKRIYWTFLSGIRG